MSPSPLSKTLLALSLGLLLVSCSTTRPAAQPSVGELENLVLIIQETAGGQVLHSWRHSEGFELSRSRHQARGRDGTGRIVFASGRERDCHAEYLQCLKECESSGLPSGFEHIERGGSAHSRFCRDECRQPYLDCEELQELRALRPYKFTTIDTALDWLKRNRGTLLVGSVVVIAGVVFVVVSAGAGAIVLAPALLLASPGVGIPTEYQLARALA
jgi:hypothetical protein